MIYYCPFCGGRAPESKRASRFEHVSDSEQRRIYALFHGINTEDQVRAAFGQPDLDINIGTTIMHPEKNGQPAHGEALRSLTYKNLSTVADIVFNVSDGGKVRGTWVQKPKNTKDG